MSDSASMDFLGQKRRVRPVRKVQVSTHFDDFNITANGSSTPEPPGPPNLDETILKVVENDSAVNKENGVNVPETRPAVYATKFPSPPQELNTLVPEDFNLIDFTFSDFNHKKTEEVIKTDHHFIVEEPKVEETKDPEVEESKEQKPEEVARSEEVNETKTEEKEVEQELKSVEPASNTAAIAATTAVAVTAAVATAAALSTVEEKDEEVTVPVEEPAPEVVEEPLRKVSEARKSLEPSKSPVDPEIKPTPIILAEVPKPAEKVVEAPKVVEKEKEPETEVKEAPVIIAEVPKPKEEPEIVKKDIEEITAAPPPLPTDNAHLLASRDSLKPSLLPVMPVNGAPSVDLDAPKPQAASSPLATSAITADELEQLRKELDEQKLALEREIDNKKALESQIQAMISKTNAQDEALKYKNESLEQLHSDYLKTNNDLTAARSEKEKLETALAKAEEELATISESNAKAYLEKSEEVTELKDKLAEFAAIIGQKNKEIDSLQRQLDEVKRTNVNTALENVQQYEKIEDELMKMVEEEILRMQDTIEEQRAYNAKLQMEVDAEYAYWKRRLEVLTEDKKLNNNV